MAGLRSFITSGLEVASATSRDATERTCNLPFSMDGNVLSQIILFMQEKETNLFRAGIGHPLARGSLHPESKFLRQAFDLCGKIFPFFRCRYCEWSRSGGLKKSQPDNRQNTFPSKFGISFHLSSKFNLFHLLREAKQGGKDEGCIGILNNFYQDGIKWHDIECRHKKPIICQVDSGHSSYIAKSPHFLG